MHPYHQKLRALADEKHRAFQQKLLPGVPGILGVRIPFVRKLAREIIKGDWRAYLAAADCACYEDTLLRGMVIALAEMGWDERRGYLADYIPLIADWGTCDIVTGDMKFIKTDRETFLEFLRPYLVSGKEFELRFAIVVLMEYYMDKEHLPLLFEAFDAARHEGYYVKMAVAWAVSMCYVAFPRQTTAYLEKNKLDDFTYDKSLQKIVESRRVDDQAKDAVRAMKRKKRDGAPR